MMACPQGCSTLDQYVHLHQMLQQQLTLELLQRNVRKPWQTLSCTRRTDKG